MDKYKKLYKKLINIKIAIFIFKIIKKILIH